MNEHLFVLGRTPQLALLELQMFFPSATLISPHVVQVAEEAIEGEGKTPQELIDALGGTVKIAGVRTHASSLDAESVAQLLLTEPSGHLVFGISKAEGEQPVPSKFLATVKELLQQKGRQARFIAAQHGASLSSVVVSKQRPVELVVVETTGGIVLSKTIAVQNADMWNMRDYGRPFADPKAGMLPPKVARMAVNIALGDKPRTMNDEPRTLLDPFCGMGTILAEGLLAGWRVLGSDQAPDVVEKAKKNLGWLTRRDPVTSQDVKRQGETLSDWRLFVSDATHVSEHLPSESVDAIVTEPFMGSTRLGGNNPIRPITQSDQLKTIKNTIKGLEKLYLGCLKDWRNILKPGGKVVMAIPGFHIGDKMLYVKNVVDRCENFGYTKLVGPIEYSRPQAVVRREFFVFRKN